MTSNTDNPDVLAVVLASLEVDCDCCHGFHCNSVEFQRSPAPLLHRHNDSAGCYGITLEDLDSGRHSCLINLNFYSRDTHDITRLRIQWESRSYHLHDLQSWRSADDSRRLWCRPLCYANRAEQ